MIAINVRVLERVRVLVVMERSWEEGSSEALEKMSGCANSQIYVY
jgi:hypothetical protein